MPTNTQVMDKVTKVAVIKAWAPIVTATIALIGSVVVSWMSASASKLNTIAENLDKRVIPKLEETIGDLKVKVTKLEVYQEVFEKEIDKLKAKGTGHPPRETVSAAVSMIKTSEPKAKKFELPRVQLVLRNNIKNFPVESSAEKQ